MCQVATRPHELEHGESAFFEPSHVVLLQDVADSHCSRNISEEHVVFDDNFVDTCDFQLSNFLLESIERVVANVSCHGVNMTEVALQRTTLTRKYIGMPSRFAMTTPTRMFQCVVHGMKWNFQTTRCKHIEDWNERTTDIVYHTTTLVQIGRAHV